MLKPWAEIGLAIIYLFGFSITVVGFSLEIKKFLPVYRNARKQHGILVSFFKSVFEVFGRLLAAILVTAFIAVTFYVFGTIKPPPDTPPKPTITPTNKLSPSPTSTVLKETKLDDYSILSKRPDEAFVFQQWTDLYPIKINNIEYENSIGVRVPAEACEYFKNNHDTQRKDYNASIEYSLAYQFDTLRFQYGIDDNTFREDGLYPPQCHFWIIVESCGSDADSDEKPVELYRTDRMNYRRTLRVSKDIDVSDVETIRLTVYWEFDVIQSKPLAFNVAIVNPILYTAEN
jgi:hypothetical protein